MRLGDFLRTQTADSQISAFVSGVIRATIAHEPCLFCNLPADRLFLHEKLAVALWDGYPVSSGHALIIVRRHIPTWFDADDLERAAMFALLETAKAVIDERHSPDGYNIGINNGAVAGQTIFHLHIHLIPRFRGDVVDPRGGVRHVIHSKANYTINKIHVLNPESGKVK